MEGTKTSWFTKSEMSTHGSRWVGGQNWVTAGSLSCWMTPNKSAKKITFYVFFTVDFFVDAKQF